MNKTQIYKSLVVAIFAILFMFVFEIIFSIDSVCVAITNFISGINSWVVYLVIWAIVFIQVTIIPVPMWVVINAAVVIPAINLSLKVFDGWLFILIVLSATIVGVIIAYIIGNKFGVRAIKWCAGDENDFNKWSEFVNKKGKIWYALSVLLPVFPDDILCFVAGALKFNFAYFLIINIFFRFIGIVAMLLTLSTLHSFNNSGFPFSVVLWGVLLIACVIACVVIKNKVAKEKNKERN